MSTNIVKNFIVLLFLTVFASATAFAQGGVTGRVEDAMHHAVPGAAVTLKNKKTSAERTVTTDADGKFSFQGTASDELEIAVKASGFSTITQPVTLTGETVVELSPAAIEEQVTVTATRTQVSTEDTAEPVSIVDRERLEQKQVNTIGDVFRSLPGSATNNEGAFQVRPRIRGLESNRVLVLVDGERLNNSRTTTSQSGIEPGLVDMSQIESVEVVRGAGSVLYGTDALAGTVNIITRDTPARVENGFRWGASFSTFYSSNENGRRGFAAITGASNRFAFRISQSMERFGNYFTGKKDGVVPEEILLTGGIPGNVTTDGEVLNSQAHGSNTHATTRFFLNDTNTLRLNYERRREANIGSAGLYSVFNGFFPFSNRDKFGARYDVVNLTNNLQRLSFNAYYQKQPRNFTNILTVAPVPPFFPGLYQTSETVTNTNTAGYDLQTDWKLGAKHLVVAGTSFFRDKNSDRRLITTSTTPSDPHRTFRTSRSVPDATLSNFATFIHDEFDVTNRLKLIGGLRFDRFATEAIPTAEFSFAPLTPTQIEQLGLAGLTSGLNVKNNSITGDVGVLYKLTNELSASVRIGRSFRTPNISERFFTDFASIQAFQVGDPNLKPESGINVDAGVKYRSSRFAASATYFDNDYHDFLASRITSVTIPRPGQPPIPVYQTANYQKVRINGFEAEFEAPIKISLGYLTPYGNFSYLRGEDKSDDLPLDNISPVRVNGGFRWTNFLRSYFFDYEGRIVTKQTRLGVNGLAPVSAGGNGGAPEPGYVTHNISGGYYFRRHERYNFNINAGISNLFNRSYSEQFVYAPARGRSFTIGTTWEIK